MKLLIGDMELATLEGLSRVGLSVATGAWQLASLHFDVNFKPGEPSTYLTLAQYCLTPIGRIGEMQCSSIYQDSLTGFVESLHDSWSPKHGANMGYKDQYKRV
jgi:hypothetical protein